MLVARFCDFFFFFSHPDGLFPAKKASKFRDWLDCSTLELKPNSMAMEILSYLAYETVAQACEVATHTHTHLFSSNVGALFEARLVLSSQVMDLSLLVKQEMTVKTNPISHVISASYIHYNTHSEVKPDSNPELSNKPQAQPLPKCLCGIRPEFTFQTFCTAVKEGSRLT